MEAFSEYLNIPPELLQKLLASLVIFLELSFVKILTNILVKRKIGDVKHAYYWRRFIVYAYTVLLIVLVGRIWIEGIGSLSTFLGLTSAGIAIAMHDLFANVAGWAFIMWRKPLKPGDRIQIGELAGDVIDIRLFQFSIVEIGNWIDADQSTGRIIHIPNSKVLKEPLANYHEGFEYIWHEIPVLVTFESDWKKTKDILAKIVAENTEHLSEGAAEQIRNAARKYFIFFHKLTPIVYTTVKDNGVLLTIRHIVKPRQRRGVEQKIWEAILVEFARHDDVDLAYPTTRVYFEEPLSGTPKT